MYWKIEFDGIHRCVKRPRKLMPPQRFHYNVLHVLELVGFSARLAGVRDFRRRGIDYRGSSLGGRCDHRHRGQRTGERGSVVDVFL